MKKDNILVEAKRIAEFHIRARHGDLDVALMNVCLNEPHSESKKMAISLLMTAIAKENNRKAI